MKDWPVAGALRNARFVYRYLTGPLRLKPDYLIIGAQKAGTSSLYANLILYPSVYRCFNFEVHYYDRHWGRGANWYRSHFCLQSVKWLREHIHHKTFITGEKTPAYLYHPLAPLRASQTVPDSKLIAILRNPVDRTYSHYQHNRRKGQDHLSFEKAIEAEEERLAADLAKLKRGEHETLSEAYFLHSYLNRGIYVDQLKRWLDYYPKERLMVIKSEDYFADHEGVYRRMFDFLGLPYEVFPGTFVNRNHGGYKSEMSPELHEKLAAYFAPHNQRLYDLVGEDFGW